MIFGIPLEIRTHENRVGAAPFLVEELVKGGHQVFVEAKAGERSLYPDTAYEKSGASIVPSPEKLYGQSEFVLKVREPKPVEYELISPHHTVFAYFSFFNNIEMSRALLARGCTCVAYEMIRSKNGNRPLLNVDRQIAGQLAVQHGGFYLQTHLGGRGVLIGEALGVSPSQVVILGATATGISAANHAAKCGATVYLLDSDQEGLELAKAKLPPNVNTLLSHEQNFQKIFPATDLLIAAIQEVDQKSPVVVSEEAVGWLPKGAVIVDLDMDYGGSVSTSNATTCENPTYIKNDIIHYCVPNLAGTVPASASEALSNALLSYIQRIMENGFVETLKADEELRNGLMVYEGRVANRRLAEALSVSYSDFMEESE